MTTLTTRRDMLALAAGFAVIPYGFAGARDQVLGVYRKNVGDIIVTALLDGFLQLDPAMLNGSDPETDQRLLASAFRAAGPVDTAINAYVIETGDRMILVDGGAASAFGPNAGKLSAALKAAGIAPDKINTIFCTHLHPDHIGAFTIDGAPAFARAEFVVNEADRAFWTNEANFASAPDQVKGMAAAASGVVSAYEKRLKTVSDGADLAPGVTVSHLPGHTPGHSGLMLSSGDSQMLIWADIVHLGPIQFAKPEVTIPFDVDQPLAAATRAKVLDMAATDKLEIAGSHIDFPSFGHVERVGDGYRFVASPWDYQL